MKILMKSKTLLPAFSLLIGLTIGGMGYAGSSDPAASIVKVIPYKVINVDQNYEQNGTGLGVKEIADMAAYIGGGADKVKLAITNNLSKPVWLVQQTANKSIIGLDSNATVQLPSSDWKTSDPKNLYMSIVICPSKPSPFDPSTPPADCINLCHSPDTSNVYQANDSELKVPYGKTINTMAISGDGTAASTHCEWNAGQAPDMPPATLDAFVNGADTGNAAIDDFSKDVIVDAPDGQILLHSPFNHQEYAALAQQVEKGNEAKNCAFYTDPASGVKATAANSQQILCKYDIHIVAGKYNNAHDAVLQVLINNGVRAISPVEMADAHLTGQPNYNEVEVGTNDVSAGAVNVVDLDNYFADPSQSSPSNQQAKHQ